ncbi:unnamed protein product [Arabidopsis thaliana]|uniref:Uncharacterized protein n=1 Tax=Arabidopsis thaliana TaxID=3702 RepID=A0A654ES15_ARATH|nr:unnamed protein product [Arabidopsis thaliana]
MEKVTFAASTMNIIKAIHKPTEWPLILSHIAPLLVLGSGKQDWFVLFEPTKCNTGAFFIAKSVTLDLRLSSYVARHAPRWLADDVNRKIGINKLGDLQVTTFWGYAATISRKEDMMIYTGRSQQMQKLDALRSCPILLIGTMLLLRTL